MSEYVYAGLTSQTIDIFLQDSSSTTGQGLSGLVFNSASLVASYRKGATGSRTAITLATQTVGGAYSSGGFVEIDATNMNGVYRLDIPNAAVDTEGFVTLYLYGATNLLPTALRIDCRPLPVDVKKYGGTAGTFASGIPSVNTTQFAGQTITAAAGVTIPASIASPTNITAGTITTVTTLTGHTPQTGDSFARIGALGAGLTSLAPAATALSTAVWTATIANRIDVAVSTRLAPLVAGRDLSVAATTGAVVLDSATALKINRIEAVATGTVTGAGTSTEVFVGPSATLTITVDSSGNRSAVVVT